MADARYQSFTTFWPFYLSQHMVPACRHWHFGGTTVVVGLLVTAIGTQTPLLVPLCLLAGYGPAWVGHFLIEKNRPATFKYPLWSLIADFRMWALMARGKLWGGDPVAELSLTVTQPQSTASA